MFVIIAIYFKVLGLKLKKIYLLFVALLCSLSALNALDFKVVSVEIPKQDDSILKIPASNLQVGDSGIITKNVNGNEFIIAKAEVASINNNIAELKLSPFDTLNEKYLPKPKAKVSQGDKAIFKILYNRALIIAPNQNTYQNISNDYKNITFIHPDIFITFLAKEGVNMPTKDNFRNFCDKYDVGLVFIATKQKINILNCQSFKILESSPYTLQDPIIMTPFFTRISAESLGKIFNVKKFVDYETYFGGLLESK